MASLLKKLVPCGACAAVLLLPGLTAAEPAPASEQRGASAVAGGKHGDRAHGRKAAGKRRCPARSRRSASEPRKRASRHRCEAVWHKRLRRPTRVREALASPGGCACGQGGHSGGPPAEGPDSTPAPGRPFAPTSFWNMRLPRDAPLDPSSEALVADLVDQVDDYGPWINTYSYSTPVYTVGARTPRVAVTLDKAAPTLAAAFASVPVPHDAEAAQGQDAHMVVWQPATDTMWEFWHMRRSPDGWHAEWGGRMEGVSANPGHFLEPDWGATATGLPLLGGLIRIDELRRGRIDHALDLSLVRTRRWVWSWPAQRTDGWIEGADAIPEGARFRLDPRLDLDELDLPPVTRMIAEAAQRYGIVIRDRGGAITFFGEDPAPTGSNPYYGPSGFFGGRSPDQLLSRFPWARLQLLRMDLRSH